MRYSTLHHAFKKITYNNISTSTNRTTTKYDNNTNTTSRTYNKNDGINVVNVNINTKNIRNKINSKNKHENLLRVTVNMSEVLNIMVIRIYRIMYNNIRQYISSGRAGQVNYK